MNLSLSRIEELFPQFNRVAITEYDIWRFAKRRKIIIKIIPLPEDINGVYKRIGGRHFIFINEALSPLRKLHALLHEICHYIFDEPNESDLFTLYRGSEPNRCDRRERRADAFAVIAMMPLSDLLALTAEELAHNQELEDLARDRYTVLGEFGN